MCIVVEVVAFTVSQLALCVRLRLIDLLSFLLILTHDLLVNAPCVLPQMWGTVFFGRAKDECDEKKLGWNFDENL